MGYGRTISVAARIKTHIRKATIGGTHFLYLKLKMLAPISQKHRCNALLPLSSAQEREGSVKVAFICDEMTWQDFHNCCHSIFLHPKLWRDQLERFRPDILFCESAWSGIDACADAWRGRIYRDRRVSFENRDVLIEILKYCHAAGITTAFWNKEDPAFGEHPIYDFSSTALLFEHIFTTDTASVSRYRAHGHQSVHTLPFGVNTAMFYPAAHPVESQAAFFAGSWYGDMPDRCRDLEELFSYILAQGWSLDIYDRQSAKKEKRYRFPERYAAHIHPAVPFIQMPDIYRQYHYGINVNTVTDSPTMLSRRILQLAACGVTIVTNDAAALDAYRDCLAVYRVSENGPVFIEGIWEKMHGHTTDQRFRQMLTAVHIPMESTIDHVQTL